LLVEIFGYKAEELNAAFGDCQREHQASIQE